MLGVLATISAVCHPCLQSGCICGCLSIRARSTLGIASSNLQAVKAEPQAYIQHICVAALIWDFSNVG